MAKQIEDLEKKITHRVPRYYNMDSPFAPTIEDAPVQTQIPIPRFFFYSGKNNQYDHLSRYESIMKQSEFDEVSNAGYFKIVSKTPQ